MPGTQERTVVSRWVLGEVCGQSWSVCGSVQQAAVSSGSQFGVNRRPVVHGRYSESREELGQPGVWPQVPLEVGLGW